MWWGGVGSAEQQKVFGPQGKLSIDERYDPRDQNTAVKLHLRDKRYSFNDINIPILDKEELENRVKKASLWKTKNIKRGLKFCITSPVSFPAICSFMHVTKTYAAQVSKDLYNPH